MTRISKHGQWFACCLCVILALACTLCVFMPHLHECDSTECAICELLSLFQEAVVPPAAAVALVCIAGSLCFHSSLYRGIILCSLVQLKVKLSD